MPAFDLLNFNWNITPADHVGNGDPFRYQWYRKKTHVDGDIVITLHTTVEVGVDGYYVGEFDPALTLVQYSYSKGADGQIIEDSIQLNVASSDDEGDVATIDALFGDTWRDFLTNAAHAAHEKHAIAVSRGELAAPGGEGADVTAMLTSALEMSKAAASPDHDEYDDALGGLFGGFEGAPADSDDGLELRDSDTDQEGGVRPGVSRRISFGVQSPDVYIEDSPTEVMRAVVPTELEDTEGGVSGEGTDEVDVSGEGAVSVEGTTEGTVSDDGTAADEGTGEGAAAGEGTAEGTAVDEKDDALPADLQAVLDKYGPDVLAKLLGK